MVFGVSMGGGMKTMTELSRGREGVFRRNLCEYNGNLIAKVEMISRAKGLAAARPRSTYPVESDSNINHYHDRSLLYYGITSL